MPSTPTYTKCSHLGCKNNRSKFNSFCMEHGGRSEIRSVRRKESQALYNSALWDRIRRSQLSKQPLCQSCLSRGRIEQAYHVDHLFPFNALSPSAFTVNVFQSLCHECHSYKTGLEQRGILRHFTTPPVDYTLSDYQKVISQHLA